MLVLGRPVNRHLGGLKDFAKPAECSQDQQGSGCIIHLNIATCKWKWWFPTLFCWKKPCFKWRPYQVQARRACLLALENIGGPQLQRGSKGTPGAQVEKRALKQGHPFSLFFSNARIEDPCLATLFFNNHSPSSPS